MPVPINEAREPRRTMGAQDVVALLDACGAAGVVVWLEGGWGVDALLGEQTREHDDVDLVVSLEQVPRLLELLGARGFRLVDGAPHTNFVLHDAPGLQVDVHPVRFDEQGAGVYRWASGEEWIYPAEGFAGRGRILDRPVRCLTPEVQVRFHAGYDLDAGDYADLRALRERFGVEIPARG